MTKLLRIKTGVYQHLKNGNRYLVEKGLCYVATETLVEGQQCAIYHRLSPKDNEHLMLIQSLRSPIPEGCARDWEAPIHLKSPVRIGGRVVIYHTPQPEVGEPMDYGRSYTNFTERFPEGFRRFKLVR